MQFKLLAAAALGGCVPTSFYTDQSNLFVCNERMKQTDRI